MEGDYDEFLENLCCLEVFGQLKTTEGPTAERIISQRLNLLVEHEGSVFVWSEERAALMRVSLKELRVDPDNSRVRTLRCTHAPSSPVERLIMSKTGKHVALICQEGIWIVEMPPPTKQLHDRINCRSFPLGERYFASAGGGGRVLQARWHPSSEADIHLVVLTADSCLRIFNILDPEAAEQTMPLIQQPTALQSTSELALSKLSKATYALDDSDNVVDFDFGPKRAVPKYFGFHMASESCLVLQVFILKENGDVHFLYPRLHEKRYPLFLSDALPMHPPAEDNYGVDACSVLCLSTTPTLLVVATAAGNVYHCVVLDQEGVDGESETEPGSVPSQMLYVYEGIDLELSGADEGEQDEEPVGLREQLEEDASCVVVHADPVVSNRYHCSHRAGVHMVTLSWLENFNQFFNESDEHFMAGSLHLPCKVEHMVATQPLPDSQSLPVVGLCISTDRLLGITLICVTSLGECLAIRLLADVAKTQPLTSESTDGDSLVSPLRRLRTEDFLSKIRRMLERTKLPVLRSVERSNHKMSQQELFRLLVEHTQMFRREISKLEQVRDEIAKRAAVLSKQKTEQMTDLDQIEEDRQFLVEKEREIALKCVEVQKGQEQLMERLKHLLRDIQTQQSVLSDAEKSFSEELEAMDGRLHHFTDQIEKIDVKMKYRQESLEREPEMELSSSQNKQIRQILQDNGDMISAVTNQLKRLKSESGL